MSHSWDFFPFYVIFYLTVQKLYGTVEFISCDWSIETCHALYIEVESQSQTPCLQLRRRHQCSFSADCARTILTTFTILCIMITIHSTATGDMVQFFLLYILIIIIIILYAQRMGMYGIDDNIGNEVPV